MSTPVPWPTEIEKALKQSLRLLRDSWLDLVKLSIIPLLLYTGCMGWFSFSMPSIAEAGRSAMLHQLMEKIGWLYLCMLPFLYLHYVKLRYTLDRLGQRVNPSLLFYWIPQPTLLGFIGIFLLSVVYFLVTLIPLFIGVLFFILPGIALCLMNCLVILLSNMIYLWQPEQGVLHACKRAFRFTLTYWLALLGCQALLMGLFLVVYLILMIPMAIVGGIVTVISTMLSFQWGVAIVTMIKTLLGAVLGGMSTAICVYFYGQIYLAYAEDSEGAAAIATPVQPSVFGSQSPPLTSPLPPVDSPPSPQDGKSHPWGED